MRVASQKELKGSLYADNTSTAHSGSIPKGIERVKPPIKLVLFPRRSIPKGIESHPLP